jgi:hypothetical protein
MQLRATADVPQRGGEGVSRLSGWKSPRVSPCRLVFVDASPAPVTIRFE